MTNINGSFKDTFKDPNVVPSYNGVTERDFMEFSNMPEIQQAIEDGDKDEIAIMYADFIRRQGYGSVVRESIARLGLWLDVKLNAIKNKNDSIYIEYLEMQKELQKIKDEFEQVVSAQTIDGEVKLARMSEFMNKTYPSLKARLDAMEQHYYYLDNGSVTYVRTVIDDNLSRNNEVNIIGQASDDKQDYPIIYSDIKKGKRFYFEGGV